MAAVSLFLIIKNSCYYYNLDVKIPLVYKIHNPSLDMEGRL